ncbi:MAG: site-specific DNA-methyltransferase [Candidatus Nitrosocaldus sp.]
MLESANKIGYPTPSPLELPYRCIQLYTFKGDVVLYPFVGSGTTCLAAAILHRYYIGIDIDKDYVRLARRKVQEYLTQKKLTELSLYTSTSISAISLWLVTMKNSIASYTLESRYALQIAFLTVSVLSIPGRLSYTLLPLHSM